MKSKFPPLIWFPVLIFIVLLSGCAATPYHYGGADLETHLTLELRQQEQQIERGRSVAMVDGLGHYLFSLPSKLLLMNWDVDNHNISYRTEDILQEYLTRNGLHNVKVRLNQYAPGGEWRRLFLNRDMPGFFRFTVGMFANIMYTIMPGRLFGGDNYNPYTNTINIYSDVPAIALHEGGHAKDFARKNRNFRGWYAFMRILPLMPLWQEAAATSDVISYSAEEEMVGELKDSYKTLYPAYLTYVAGEGLRWVAVEPWLSYSIQFAATIPGHIVGRVKAALVEEEYPSE
jgi:hypothetical protein